MEHTTTVPVQKVRKGNRLVEAKYTVVLEVGGETILELPYHYEEKFKLYGEKGKKTLSEILPLLDPNFYWGVYLCGNKVLLHNFEAIEVVLAKCPEDAKRLYGALKRALLQKKIYSFLFLGEITKENKKKMFREILEKTGSKANHMYRKNQR